MAALVTFQIVSWIVIDLDVDVLASITKIWATYVAAAFLFLFGRRTADLYVVTRRTIHAFELAPCFMWWGGPCWFFVSMCVRAINFMSTTYWGLLFGWWGVTCTYTDSTTHGVVCPSNGYSDMATVLATNYIGFIWGRVYQYGRPFCSNSKRLGRRVMS